MSLSKLKKILSLFVLIIVLFLGSLYFGAFKGYTQRVSNENLATADIETGVLPAGTMIRQTFTESESMIQTIVLPFTAGKHPRFSYTVKSGEEVLCSGQITDGEYEKEIQLLAQPLPVKPDQTYTLELRIEEGNDAGFAYGNKVKLTRGEMPISDLNENTCLYINDQIIYGKLDVTIFGSTPMQVAKPFLYISLSCILAVSVWAVYVWQCAARKKNTLSLRVIRAMDKYSFMLRQMVSRDFKTKYKRSVLGVFWSFLNPLLTMAVQYVVFSTIFKSDILDFPVYLLTGIVCYSFFSEATATGMTAITGNVGLLTKVYIPKYIFPVARVLSSGVNFLFMLIPLFLVAWISGLHITRTYLLIPFVLLCLFLFCLGMAMALSTLMVFFRDMQFLWSVVTMLLMYATPIFYPEKIIPTGTMRFLKLNPLYHVIRLFRAVLMNEGGVPEPKSFLLCFIACVIPLILGVLIFKKEQDKFVLNL